MVELIGSFRDSDTIMIASTLVEDRVAMDKVPIQLLNVLDKAIHIDGAIFMVYFTPIYAVIDSNLPKNHKVVTEEEIEKVMKNVAVKD